MGTPIKSLEMAHVLTLQVSKEQNECAQKFGSKNSHLDNICNEEKLKITFLPTYRGLVRKIVIKCLPAINDLRKWG